MPRARGTAAAAGGGGGGGRQRAAAGGCGRQRAEVAARCGKELTQKRKIRYQPLGKRQAVIGRCVSLRHVQKTSDEETTFIPPELF